MTFDPTCRSNRFLSCVDVPDGPFMAFIASVIGTSGCIIVFLLLAIPFLLPTARYIGWLCWPLACCVHGRDVFADITSCVCNLVEQTTKLRDRFVSTLRCDHFVAWRRTVKAWEFTTSLIHWSRRAFVDHSTITSETV